MPNTGRVLAPFSMAFRDRYTRPYSTVSRPIVGATPDAPREVANSSVVTTATLDRRWERDHERERESEEVRAYAGAHDKQPYSYRRSKGWVEAKPAVAERPSTLPSVMPMRPSDRMRYSDRGGQIVEAQAPTAMLAARTHGASTQLQRLPHLASMLKRARTADRTDDDDDRQIEFRKRQSLEVADRALPSAAVPVTRGRMMEDSISRVRETRMDAKMRWQDVGDRDGLTLARRSVHELPPPRPQERHTIAARPTNRPPHDEPSRWERYPREQIRVQRSFADDDESPHRRRVEREWLSPGDELTPRTRLQRERVIPSRQEVDSEFGGRSDRVVVEREHQRPLVSPPQRSPSASRSELSPERTRSPDRFQADNDVIEAASDLVEERSPSKRESITKLLLKSKEFLKAKSLVRNRNNEIDWVATFLNVGFESNSIYSLMCPLRKGRWKAEEEKYTMELLHLIESGTLRLQHGQSIRGYIAKKLHSDDMRVLKKLSNCKMFSFARSITPSISDDDEIDHRAPGAAANLQRLEKLKSEFLRSVQLEALVAVRKYLSDSSIRDLLNGRD